MEGEVPGKPEEGPSRKGKTAAELAEKDFNEAKSKEDKAVEVFKIRLEGRLHDMDGLRLDNDASRAMCQFDLQYIGRAIELLKENYPNDPDIKLFEEMYADLSEDFDHSEEMIIDSGYDAIVLAMQKELKERGVKVEDPDHTILSKTVEDLRKAGVSPEYVVTSGNPNAKTVILFMQAHSNPGADKQYLDAAGVTESQDGIYRDVSQIVDGGLGRVVYDEGREVGEDIGLDKVGEEVPDYEKVTAGYRLKNGLKEKVVLTGAEPSGLVGSTMRRLKSGENPGKVFGYRIVANNVLVANAVVDDLNKRSDSIGVLIFGAAHEKFPAAMLGSENHPLPLSRALAGMGVNVVVVDRANITKEKMEAATKLGRKVAEETFGIKAKSELPREMKIPISKIKKTAADSKLEKWIKK